MPGSPPAARLRPESVEIHRLPWRSKATLSGEVIGLTWLLSNPPKYVAGSAGSPQTSRTFHPNRRAAAFFAALDKTNRYAVLWRIQTAKKSDTRATRIAALVAMLAKGEKIHG